MRTQARVHGENETILGVGGKRLHDLLSGFGKGAAVTSWIGDKQKIGIRKKVEFPATQPSQGQDCQPMRISRNAKCGGDCGFRS